MPEIATDICPLLAIAGYAIEHNGGIAGAICLKENCMWWTSAWTTEMLRQTHNCAIVIIAMKNKEGQIVV